MSHQKNKELHEIERMLGCIAYNISLLTTLGEKIMTAVSDYAAAQNAFNDQMDASIADLQGDVQNLNDQIAKLVASQGQLSAEDQASLDALSARSKSISDKLAALDALTPPVPPVA